MPEYTAPELTNLLLLALFGSTLDPQVSDQARGLLLDVEMDEIRVGAEKASLMRYALKPEIKDMLRLPN